MKKKKVKRLRFCGINPPRFDRSQIKIWVYLLPIAVLMAVPIIFNVSTALKPLDELFLYPPTLFPHKPTLGNFTQLFRFSDENSVPFSRYMFNSLLSSGIVVVASIIFSLMAGYVLSKKEFAGRQLLSTINTIALMFAPAAVTIPRFFVIKYLGLIDNFGAHIWPALAMPVGLFLVKQFIDQLPDALFDAAKVDGANDYFIVSRIVAPMVVPALVTVAILAFQSSWNATVASASYINNETLKTLPSYMSSITDTTSGKTVAGMGASAAANLIVFLPNLLLFIILQSRVMNTMAHSGIK